MQHVHVATSARPDRVIATGVIQPYPVTARPSRIALKVVQAFAPPPGPVRAQGMQPEEVAMRAKRVADAMAAGAQLPPHMDSRIVKAAQLILTGRPFVIKSAGRAAVIMARISPSSWEALAMRNPAYYGLMRRR